MVMVMAMTTETDDLGSNLFHLEQIDQQKTPAVEEMVLR